MKVGIAAGCVAVLLGAARADTDAVSPPMSIDHAIDAGAIMPFALTARHDQRGIIWSSYGGLDSGAASPVLSSVIEGTLLDRVAIRAGVANDQFQGMVHPFAGAMVDVARGPVDVSLGADYQQKGWNTVPALGFHAVISHAFEGARLTGTVTYNAGLEDDERSGELGISYLRRLLDGFYLGAEMRGRVDLERDNDEPPGERDFDLEGGVLATYSLGRFALTALAGPTAYKLRLIPGDHVGVMTLAGIGASF